MLTLLHQIGAAFFARERVSEICLNEDCYLEVEEALKNDAVMPIILTVAHAQFLRRGLNGALGWPFEISKDPNALFKLVCRYTPTDRQVDSALIFAFFMLTITNGSVFKRLNTGYEDITLICPEIIRGVQ